MKLRQNIFKAISICCLFFALTGCKNQIDYQQQYKDAEKHFLPAWKLIADGEMAKSLIACDSILYSVKAPSLMMQFVRFEYKIVAIDKINRRDKISANDTVVKYIDSAIALMEMNQVATKKSDRYSLMLLNKAEVLYQLHQPEKANELFFFIEKFSAHYNDYFTQFLIADKMGFITFRQKNYPQSIVSFKKSIAYHQLYDPQDYYKTAETIDNVAICFTELNILDSAIFYYNKALRLLADNRNSSITSSFSIIASNSSADRSRGVILGNLAQVFQKKGMLDSAISFSKQSIALNATVCCEQRDAQMVQMRLIDLYFQNKSFNNMYAELQALRKGLDSLPSAEPELNYKRQMALYFEQQHQPNKAYPFLQAFIALQDSSAKMEQKDLESNIVKDLQLKNQDADLTILKKDNQLSKLYLWITIGLIATALGVIILVYYNFKKSTQQNIALSLLNEQVIKQKAAVELANKEKDRILRVVAHDLRNPIGGVAALAGKILERDEMDDYSGPLLQNIESTSIHSLLLINDLLQTNHIEED